MTGSVENTDYLAAMVPVSGYIRAQMNIWSIRVLHFLDQITLKTVVSVYQKWPKDGKDELL